MRAVIEIAIKEFRSILRDPILVAIIFILPFVIVAILGKALKFEIVDEKFAVIDYSETALSQEIITLLDRSPQLAYCGHLSSVEEVVPAFIEERLTFVIVIPKGLERGEVIDVFVDGSDLMFGEALSNHIRGALFEGGRFSYTFLDNPTRRSDHPPLPGLVMIALILISSIMLSLSVNRERERGSARLLIITPASMEQIIAGKALPYFLISFFHGLSIGFLFKVMFGIALLPILLPFLIITSLFSLTSMMLGLLFASFVKSELELLIACWLLIFLPNMLFCGFLFPLHSMNRVAFYIAPYLPGTLFITLFKAIIFRGAKLAQLTKPLLILFGEAVILYSISIMLFKRNFFKK